MDKDQITIEKSKNDKCCTT